MICESDNCVRVERASLGNAERVKRSILWWSRPTLHVKNHHSFDARNRSKLCGFVLRGAQSREGRACAERMERHARMRQSCSRSGFTKEQPTDYRMHCYLEKTSKTNKPTVKANKTLRAHATEVRDAWLQQHARTRVHFNSPLYTLYTWWSGVVLLEWIQTHIMTGVLIFNRTNFDEWWNIKQTHKKAFCKTLNKI